MADFDNLILSHSDRTRVIADAHRAIVITKNGMVLPTILVDGFVAGTWSVSRVRKIRRANLAKRFAWLWRTLRLIRSNIAGCMLNSRKPKPSNKLV